MTSNVRRRRRRDPSAQQNNRVNALFIPLAIGYVLIEGRLAWLQLVQGKQYREQAFTARKHTTRIAARHGSIFDANNQPMALSVYNGTLGFDPQVMLAAKTPEQIKKNEHKLTESIDVVSRIVASGSDVELIRARMASGIANARMQAQVELASNKKRTRVSHFYPLVSDVPYAKAEMVWNLKERPIGLGFINIPHRSYSTGSAAAPVIGMVGPTGTPLAGLEYSFDQWLSGEDGVTSSEIDQYGHVLTGTILTEKLATDGADVYTTIDPVVQQMAVEEAQKIYDKYHPTGVSITIVNPDTGDIIAMVSMPTVDPDAQFKNEQHVVIGDPRLIDRCSSVLYEPGSTLKSLTVAAALNGHYVDMQTRFTCTGKLKVGNKFIHCPVYGKWDAHGHGSVNMDELLMHSCNVGAAQIGRKMGPHALYDAEDKFGLTSRVDIHLPVKVKGRLKFDKSEKIYTDSKVTRVAFGHSIATTPLQVVLAYAALANGGNLMAPRLVTKVAIPGPGGKVLLSEPVRVVDRPISGEVSHEMTSMLGDVVEKGTGKTAAIEGYRVAGKTGTAKKYLPGKYASSFAGYLPASPGVKPRAAILIVVDEPTSAAHYGATVAAPSFALIGSKLMRYWHVPEDDPTSIQFHNAQRGLKHNHDAPASESHLAL